MLRKSALFLLVLASVLYSQSSLNELVNVKEIIPDIVLDLKYSNTGNFTGQKLYTTNECLLCIGAVNQLKMVQDSLRNIRTHNGNDYPAGIGIKIWDGYRPRAVQYLMWEIFPNPTYVADPSNGSVHNRGGAVDLTLVNLATGQELSMPTEFDFFGEEAWHDYMNLPANVLANRALLRDLMENVGGFTTYVAEWWHYSYPPATSFPLLDFQMK